MATFAGRLKQLRTKAGLSRQELADKLGLTSVAVYSWERGGASPSFQSLQKLAKVLGVSLDEFSELRVPIQTHILLPHVFGPV